MVSKADRCCWLRFFGVTVILFVAYVDVKVGSTANGNDEDENVGVNMEIGQSLSLCVLHFATTQCS